MTTQETEQQRAEKSWQDGIEAYNDGKLERAGAFADAEIRFRFLGDVKRAGDSCSMLADAQRQNNQLKQAIVSYQRAVKLYQEAGKPLNEASSVLSIGHVERRQAHLDKARNAYLQARDIYRTQQDTQGLGHATLALGMLRCNEATSCTR
ncbi:MAG TPA: tetratricopeptide repeat protein [Ktedonobacteraceae bacterium]|nr:tetratricopeptide repeat protein [Ktedonobacteraceae bacterium]